MAKFYGKIGYGITEETSPGVWTENQIEKDVVGEWLRDSKRSSSTNKVNSDITFNNLISIVIDPYSREHFQFIKYVKDGISGVKWTVTNAELQYPRLILTLGGIYNV